MTRLLALMPRVFVAVAVSTALITVAKSLPREQTLIFECRGFAPVALHATLSQGEEEVAGIQRHFPSGLRRRVRYSPQLPNGDYLLTLTTQERDGSREVVEHRRLTLEGNETVIRLNREPPEPTN